MHVFPQLRKLEQKYERELVIVGVHSAKFPSERDTPNVREAILRYDIEHPVVNDIEFAIWQQYGIRAWPSFMFIDPKGKVVGKHEGEIPLESFDKLLDNIIREFDERGEILRTPRSFKLEKEKELDRPISFPGKVLAYGASRRLFLADSNHNRILVTSLDGALQQVIGSGNKGFHDGDFSSAQFNDPQGMALENDILYVADTKNHSIRRVDLVKGVVDSIAGVGEQATSFSYGGKAKATALNSPWDLAVHNSTLYIAMAGFHQLWALDLKRGQVAPYAGSGREGLSDGPLPHAWLAQPSAIVTDGSRLYFADSETSSIRTADMGSIGRVGTIVGVDLFDFGDVDGVGDAVRLQHPIGLCIYDGVLCVADTYNNKIKQVFPSTRGASSFLGSGQPGYQDGPGTEAQFHEPGGLSIAEGKLYIADTNNHALRVADLETKIVETLEIRGI